MSIAKKKLVAIFKLVFSKILKELKIYIDLTKWFRMYILYYVQIIEFFENRKTFFLKNDLFKNNSKKQFFRTIVINNSNDEKYEIYQHLQNFFNKSSFLVHFNSEKSFFIDVNAFKQKGFENMTFHVLNDSDNDMKIKHIEIQSIMFLNKRLFDAKKKYWPTKLKIIDVMWIVKKVRHFIKFCKKSFTLIFTNHFAIVDLMNQIFFITFNTDKLNLRLMRAFQFFFTLFIHIKVKFERFHVISNALSRLKSSIVSDDTSILKNLYDVDFFFVKAVFERKTSFWDVKFWQINETLNVYFDERISLIKMNEKFFDALKQTYESNDQWKKIKNKLNDRVNSLDISDEIEFVLKDRRIYYVSKKLIFRLCVFWNLKKKIFNMIHDDQHHCDFHRVYAKISSSLYIRHLFKKLRRYIKHCKTCMKKQIIKHASYEKLNFIKILALLFHIITIDFVVCLSRTSNEMNAMLFTTDKFFKRINLIVDMSTWFVSEWAFSWLTMLQKKNWSLSRVIISNRNSKFVIVFWKIIFNHLNVVLLFFTVYHSQTDGQSERINQIVKIILKYAFMKKNAIDFFKFFFSIQAIFNNFVNASTGVFFNEILYGFKILKTIDFFDNDLTKTRTDDDNLTTTIEKERSILKKKTEKTINHVQTMMKIRYDSRHKTFDLKSDQKIFIKFHKNYNQSDLINRKFNKQKIKSMIITKKIKRLTYKFDIFFTWKIHSVIFVIQLKSVFSENDFYEKKILKPESMKIEDGNDPNVYEIEKIIAKKMIYIDRNRRRQSHSEYRVKWLGWKNQHNRWMKKKELNDCKKLLKNFENRNQKINQKHEYNDFENLFL